MDIFFSYRSDDRERVRMFRDALMEHGFEVFWDQEVPAGKNWNAWILEALGRARCVVVFWSHRSVTSTNVHHEATIAREQDKLIPVLLDSLTASEFPMGHYSTQAIKIAKWSGDQGDLEWKKLFAEIEAKITPAWISKRWLQKEVQLKAQTKLERQLREQSEASEKLLEARLSEESRKSNTIQKALESAQLNPRRANIAWIGATLVASVLLGLVASGAIGLRPVPNVGSDTLAAAQSEIRELSTKVVNLSSEIAKLTNDLKVEGQKREVAVSRNAILENEIGIASKNLTTLTTQLSSLTTSLAKMVDRLPVDAQLEVLRSLAAVGNENAIAKLVDMHLSAPQESPVLAEEAADLYLRLIRRGYRRPPTLKETWEWKAAAFQVEVLKKLPGYSSKQVGTFTRESLVELNKLFGTTKP